MKIRLFSRSRGVWSSYTDPITSLSETWTLVITKSRKPNSGCNNVWNVSPMVYFNDSLQLNDVVYLLGDPGTQPDVELVFIHGLNFNKDNYMHWTTWLARDEAGRTCWPAKWLQREEGFPVAARVLSLQYDSSPIRSATAGRFDLVSLGESLLQQLYLSPANVGQNNCPVVFVCHSLGGIVAKTIVVTAKQKFALHAKAKNLLGNLKGFFFYSTPHSGWKLCYEQYKGQRGPLLQSLKELETKTHRLNDDFQCMKNSDEYKKFWRFFVVAELCPTVVRVSSFINSLVVFGIWTSC